MPAAKLVLPRAPAGEQGPPLVALLVETSLASGRDIISGIAQYLREHQPWALYHKPMGLAEAAPAWLRRWQGQGIIVRAQRREVARAVAVADLDPAD